MKLTLAFGVYNKQDSIESVLDSWLGKLSGSNEYEVIVVFDDCRDRSVEIAHNHLRKSGLDYMFLFTDDRYEIFCNNLALKHASGDYIAFIQDDNWIHDRNWDLLLSRTLDKVPNVGAVGLLAGLQMSSAPDRIDYRRIEIDRPHKQQYFSAHKLPSYELGVWQVDSIARPFCISRELLLECGGLDEAFSPTCGDDLDLGLTLLRRGRTNLYIPFDVVNHVGSLQTMSDEFRNAVYEQAFKLNFQRHHEYLGGRTADTTKLLIPLEQTADACLEFKQEVSVSESMAISTSAVGDTEPFTLFAMPKSFSGASAVIQENAIGSWMNLDPGPEIILMGDDDGVGRFASRHGFKHIPNIRRNDFGTPLLDDLFHRGQAAASNDLCMYINADIILPRAFSAALTTCARRFDRFLMVGRRWDFDMFDRIDFGDPDWDRTLIERVKAEGVHHAPTGIDYFAFRKGVWPAIPPFALGRAVWDNWLVRDVLISGHPVVDAAPVVSAIHQNHDFNHIPGGKRSSSFNTELQRNLALADNDTTWAYTSHATWELTDRGLRMRSVSDLLETDNLNVALRCIESAYRQDARTVEQQCRSLHGQLSPEVSVALQAEARRHLILGPAGNAARLLMDCLHLEDRQLAETSFRDGLKCLSDGDHYSAIRHLENSVVSYTALPNGYYALATAYAGAGDIVSAKRACQLELSIQPDNSGAVQLLDRITQAEQQCSQDLTRQQSQPTRG